MGSQQNLHIALINRENLFKAEQLFARSIGLSLVPQPLRDTPHLIVKVHAIGLLLGLPLRLMPLSLHLIMLFLAFRTSRLEQSRKAEGDAGSLAHCAVDFDASTLSFDQLFGNRQAQTAPA